MMSGSRKRKVTSWADLPTELLAMIGKSLKTRIYVCVFRSVCSSWRSCISPFQNPLQFHYEPFLNRRQFPYDLGHPKSPFTRISRTISSYHLREYSIYFLEPIKEESPSSLNSFFLAVKELRGNKVGLLNPLTSWRINRLPPNFPEELNLSDFRITELQRLYGMELKYCGILRYKVVLLDQTHSETVMAVLQEENLGFFKLGTEDWVLLKNCTEHPILDVAVYKGKVCGVLGERRAAAIIDSSFNWTEFVSPTYPDGIHCTSYLVESFGDLFLVDQIVPESSLLMEFDDFKYLDLSLPLVASSYRQSMAFKVYTLHAEDEEYRWIEVTNLGDRVMFISGSKGGRWSFSLSSHQIPRLRNCIVFTNARPIGLDMKDSRGVLVFNMQTCTLVKMDQFPGEFNMFWPPTLTNSNPA